MNPLSFLARALGVKKYIAIAGLLALFVVGFVAWDFFDDRAAIKQDRSIVRTKALKADRDAMIEADRRAAELAIITAGQQADTIKDIDDAIKAKPDAARRPAGPAVNAAADSLRSRANRDD